MTLKKMQVAKFQIRNITLDTAVTMCRYLILSESLARSSFYKRKLQNFCQGECYK